MAGQTTYYQLETYESNDVPDLRDQYNSSMAKIDGALNTIANTANSAATGVAQAVQNAQVALESAASALSVAQSAQTSANEASTAAASATSVASDAATNAQTALTAASTANNGVASLNTRVTALEVGQVVQYEQGYVDVSLAPNTNTSTHVDLTKQFVGSQNPYFDAMVSGGGTAPQGVFLSTTSEGKTGFNINAYNSTSATKSVRIRWCAIQAE